MGGGTVKTGTFRIENSNKTMTISTGLSNIQRLVVIGIIDAHPTLNPAVVAYSSNAPTKYSELGTGTYGGGSKTIGANGTAGMAFAINSISNGNVSITSPSGGSYGSNPCKGTYYWYAE